MNYNGLFPRYHRSYISVHPKDPPISDREPTNTHSMLCQPCHHVFHQKSVNMLAFSIGNNKVFRKVPSDNKDILEKVMISLTFCSDDSLHIQCVANGGHSGCDNASLYLLPIYTRTWYCIKSIKWIWNWQQGVIEIGFNSRDIGIKQPNIVLLGYPYITSCCVSWEKNHQGCTSGGLHVQAITSMGTNKVGGKPKASITKKTRP